MAKQVIWTNTARDARQEILEKFFERDGEKKECKKLAFLIRSNVKFLSNYNFGGIESNYSGMRETTCGACTIFYKIRATSITITGIFERESKHN
jgi:hypothetical protein